MAFGNFDLQMAILSITILTIALKQQVWIYDDTFSSLVPDWADSLFQPSFANTSFALRGGEPPPDPLLREEGERIDEAGTTLVSTRG